MTANSSPLSLPKKAVYIGIILFLGLATFFASRWILADIIINGVKQDFEQWESAGSAPSLQDWETNQNRLSSAIKFNSKDAEYYSLRGLLYEWRNFIADETLSPEQQNITRKNAIAAYRTSISLRPAWPDAWAQLARQKASLRQYDQEFLLAMDKTMNLGGRETRIKLLVTEIASLAWPFLSRQTELAEQIIINIQSSLAARNFEQHIKFLEDRGQLQTFCAVLELKELRTEVLEACKKAN